MNEGIPCAVIFHFRGQWFREWHLFAQVPRKGEGLRLASQDLIVERVFWMKNIEARNQPRLTNPNQIHYPLIYAERSEPPLS